LFVVVELTNLVAEISFLRLVKKLFVVGAGQPAKWRQFSSRGFTSACVNTILGRRVKTQ